VNGSTIYAVYTPSLPFEVRCESVIYIYIYILDKALPQVLYGKYSMKRLVLRQIQHEAKGSALSGIENVRLGAIHSSGTIRNSPNSLEKQ